MKAAAIQTDSANANSTASLPLSSSKTLSA
jgi:hypothetical protein